MRKCLAIIVEEWVRVSCTLGCWVLLKFSILKLVAEGMLDCTSDQEHLMQWVQGRPGQNR
jgi:hypothetical protein